MTAVDAVDAVNAVNTDSEAAAALLDGASRVCNAGNEPVAVVELRGASASVAGRTLWGGVDLTVECGEFVAVLGPNGVGKSTLVKVLLGVLPAATGEVRVLGHRPGTAGAQIGYLPQRRSFDASLRIRGIDVVRLGLDGDRWGIPLPGTGRFGGAKRREAEARVREAIELVGASAYAHRAIGECSGGEQQRLLIAQALVRKPRLLVLDEPLDSLDLPNQASVAALIGRISRSEDVAVVMVAHDVNPILPYLDRVVYLADGGAASGTPEEVITTETLSKLFRTPVEVLRASDGRLVVVGGPEAPVMHSDRHAGALVGGDRRATDGRVTDGRAADGRAMDRRVADGRAMDRRATDRRPAGSEADDAR
ncbi:metal ABC transporter ATP-binding protein [Catenulispora pinisilvae]|uniref:metal ABC transporter ATP-binding protein n=1 Tax=Catenulispora pinisilvae TaxID=2705253 RepID=UPI001E2E9708|nr:metal ABC transporter ATP-binding protein [Catenulispora pinisilvae]